MNRFAAFVTFAVLTICINAHADDMVADGVMTGASTHIGKLLHLKWTDERIAIDREHWDASTGNKTADDKAEEQIAAMVRRGLPEEIARRMAQQRGQRGFGGGNFLTASPEGELFTELKNAAGAMSGGGGGGNDERHWNGHGNNIYMAMNVNNAQKNFRLVIREGTAPFQELVFEDHSGKGLRIQFSCLDRHLLFSQTPDGTVRVAHTCEERSEAFQCDTYEEMVERQPEFADDFGSLLEQLGINKPLTNYDPHVVQTVGRLLFKPAPDSVRKANEAITQLGADSYPAREEAQKELLENFVAWRNVIREKLTKSELDAESRMRLKSIMDNSEFDAADAELYIEQRKLLSNIDYLTSLLSEAPESLHTSIKNRIAELE